MCPTGFDVFRPSLVAVCVPNFFLRNGTLLDFDSQPAILLLYLSNSKCIVGRKE